MCSVSTQFKFYTSDNALAEQFTEIQDILRERRGEVLADRMHSPKRKRLIMKASLNGIPYVIKQEFFIFRFDRTLKTFLFGSDAKAIFRLSKHAQENGFSGIPKTYFVAERFSKGILRETISVTEFLEGQGISMPIGDNIKTELRTLITQCHNLGIISGDIQLGNFICTKQGLKMIDFRGKKVIPWLAKTRDLLQLERVFGIPYEGRRGLAGRIFFALLSCRNCVRKLLGKEVIPD